MAPFTVMGSSPRVRGKRERALHGVEHPRLIPARAGKTSSRASSPPSVWAHPRACGENLHLVTVDEAWAGSSPRVRGKPGQAVEGLQHVRLIPARAGKTTGAARPTASSPAHPRACGENIQAAASVVAEWGSSPRVRGKLPR